MTNTDSEYNGECRLCAETFLGMAREEYNAAVSRHILDEHRDVADKDLVIVAPIESTEASA